MDNKKPLVPMYSGFIYIIINSGSLVLMELDLLPDFDISIQQKIIYVNIFLVIFWKTLDL